MAVIIDVDNGRDYAIIEEVKTRKQCEELADKYVGGICVKGGDGKTYIALKEQFTVKTELNHGRIER